MWTSLTEHRAAVLLLLAGLMLPAPARAEDRTDAKPEAKVEAKPDSKPDPDATCPEPSATPLAFDAQIEVATRCYRAGAFARAIAAWDDAYRQQPAPRILYNLGRSHHRAGHELDALVMYERYLQAEPASVRRAEVESYITELRGRLSGPLPPRALAAEPAPTTATATPLYKRWWLWTIVGGVVAAGAVTGAVLGTRAAATPEYPNYRSLSF